MHEVSMGTVNLDEIEFNLLTPLNCLQPFLLVVLEVLGSSSDWLGVETLVERSFGRSNNFIGPSSLFFGGG